MNVGAKFDAAQVLHREGWPNEKIASALVAPIADVERWVLGVRGRPPPSGDLCELCEAETTVTASLLCRGCLDARNVTIMGLLSDGVDPREVAESLGVTRDTVYGVRHRTVVAA